MFWGLSILTAFSGYSNFTQIAPENDIENEKYHRLVSIFSKNKYGYTTRFMSDFEVFLQAVLNERFLDESVAYYRDEMRGTEIID